MAILVLLLSLVIAGGRRILDLQARVRSLERQAITDPLTGALNRRHMHEALVTAVERHRRSGDHASLLLIDVDCFKALNDAAGHVEGDRVLRAMVMLVQQRLRRIDALFRLGGDEFVVLLSGAWLSDARGVAEHLRASVERANLGGRRPLSISIGVAELEYEESAVEWLAAADCALYDAKHSGRNRVAVRAVRTVTTRKLA